MNANIQASDTRTSSQWMDDGSILIIANRSDIMYHMYSDLTLFRDLYTYEYV